MTEKYYINYSYASCNWLVKQTGEGEEAGKIIQIFTDKAKAEKFIKELNEKENGKRKNS